MTQAAQRWHVYLVRCADGTLYTGVTTDVARRVAQHNGLGNNGKPAARDVGARYTRARRPVKLVYQESVANRSAACKREYRIKQLTRREKLALIAAGARVTLKKQAQERYRKAKPRASALAA